MATDTPNANADITTASRLAAYEAALAVAREVDLDQVLDRIVTMAREIVPCRYAALGVADENGLLRQFITSGIASEQIREIGPYPTGLGLLGVLIHEGQPLIVNDIQADPRSVGFPPNDPPMKRLLGAPIKIGQRTLGNLYLTERNDGQPFTEADLRTLEILAAHAANAIERAELYRLAERNAEDAVRQRDQTTAILGTLPSGVLIVRQATGEILFANRQAVRMFAGDERLDLTELTPVTDFDVVREDGLPFNIFAPETGSHLTSIPVHSLQGSVVRADGHHTPVLIQAGVLPNPDEGGTSAVYVLQDISRMRDAEQLKDDFLSLISHEFRTPLTAIHGGAYLLKRQGDQLDAETRAGLLDDIVNESGRLDRMLVNMLSLAATMAGRLTIQTEPVLVAPIIRRVASEITRRTEMIRMHLEVPPDLPPIECDPEALEQVLRNLYENAIKYGPAEGTITTRATIDDGRIRLAVVDHGVGIAQEYVAHVFERFRRPGADPTIRGMGLGLYLSRLLVEAQGGTIGADSEGPGKGSTFWITLPIANTGEDDAFDH